MPTESKPETIKNQTDQAVDPAAICSAWLPLLTANGFDEEIAKILISFANYWQTTQLTAKQALRARTVGKVKLAKLRKLGIVESCEVEWERTTRKWRRDKANELEAEITKVENWKASTIRQADDKIARLRKELAELKPNDQADRS
jgi:hypothetical protein